MKIHLLGAELLSANGRADKKLILISPYFGNALKMVEILTI